MLKKVLRCKLHRVTVTRSDLHYQGSIAIDRDLMAAADLSPFESVHVWNITNGERLETYALPAPAGSGEICLNGAAARLAQAGDLVIVAAFGWLPGSELRDYEAKVVFVDDANRIVQPAPAPVPAGA